MPRPPQTLSKVQSARLAQGFQLLQKGDAVSALEVSRTLAREAPGAVDVHHLMALCQARLGQHQKAEKAFRRALKIYRKDPHLLGNFASLLRTMGRHDDSLRHYRKAVELDPGFLQGWIQLGVVAMESGRTAQALSALGRAVELEPGSSYAWHVLGNIKRSSGDLEGAEAAFRRTVELAPESSRAWVNLGMVIRFLGRPTEAQSCFAAAREAGYTGPELLDAECGTLIDLGEIDQALGHVRELIETFPQYVPGYVTRAHLIWQYGQSVAPDDDPIEQFRAAAVVQSGNIQLQLAYIGFLLELRRAEEALDKIRALRSQSDLPILGALEANALELMDRTDESGRLYERTYKAFGRRDPSFLNAYTRHLLKSGQWDRAAARATEATRLDPFNQEAWAYLGTAWRLLDDPREYWLMDYDNLVAMVDVEAPAGYADVPEFLLALAAAVEPLHKAQREPIEQSLRGGSQTAGRLFGHPDPLIAAAHGAFKQAIEKRIARLPQDPEHPFLQRKMSSVRMTGSWSVKLRSAGKHVNHIHSEGWMSSAFYLSLPPSVTETGADGQAGWIKFGQPPDELCLDLAPREVLRPSPGRVALFPSYMWHGTVPFEDDAPRVTIAFDMLPV